MHPSSQNVGEMPKGVVDFSYTDDAGSKLGFTFTSVPQTIANVLITTCAAASQNVTQNVLFESTIDDTVIITNNNGGDMNERIARLESDVSHIKTDIHGIREDTRQFLANSSDSKKDVAVILQSLVDISENLNKKASKSDVNAMISSATNKQIIWTISSLIAVVGLASTIIIKALAS